MVLTVCVLKQIMTHNFILRSYNFVYKGIILFLIIAADFICNYGRYVFICNNSCYVLVRFCINGCNVCICYNGCYV